MGKEVTLEILYKYFKCIVSAKRWFPWCCCYSWATMTTSHQVASLLFCHLLCIKTSILIQMLAKRGFSDLEFLKVLPTPIGNTKL